MAWKASLTVGAIDGNTVVASGTATGTDDDANVTDVTITVNYSSPSHLEVGSTFNLESDC